MSILLRAENISKRFPGTQALDQAHFDLEMGEIHALVGENGAGKSTFVKILAGTLLPDMGQIYFKGQKIQSEDSPSARREKGITVVFQELSLVGSLTVVENLFLAREQTTFRFLQRNHMLNYAEVLLDRVGAPGIDPRKIVDELSAPERYIVEIAKAILRRFSVLILDEPTAAFTPKEVKHLFSLLSEMRDKGKGIIYITHRLEELNEIADRVTVFRDGKYVNTLPIAEADKKRLVFHMTGVNFQNFFPHTGTPKQKVLIKVRNLSLREGLKNINFELREGEILGIAGLVGGGKELFGRALFGLHKIESGEVNIDGKWIEWKDINPLKCLNRGILYFPSDRTKEGLVMPRSIGENISLPVLKNFAGRFLLNRRKEKSSVYRAIKQMKINPPAYDCAINVLSGGNQQKVMLARSILFGGKLLILDEPTQGVDVGVKVEAYNFINSIVSNGISVILISSDLDEIINLSHRALVISGGVQVADIPCDDLHEEKLLHYYFDH